ncbi:MAG: methyltransferase domain-containing protein [Deltaproteobacteria bacterium]|nr:methyltransferase domain-containing protein [Deltaproteobacteria bacterium]
MDNPETKRTSPFNHFYDQDDFYYGLDLRPEFTGYFEKKDLAGKNALDLGCGEGRYAIWLARRGCRVTAVDISAVGIAKLARFAAENGLDIQPVHADVGKFDFPEAAFDIITATTIFDHLNDQTSKQVALSVINALKPGCILYADVFTINDPGYCAITGNPEASDVSDTAAFMARYFKENELKRLFSPLIPLVYRETVEPDLSHGKPHKHGWACLVAKKQ